MLINLRGTNGSGKTYVSHKLILDHKHTELVEPKVVLGKNFKKTNCFAVEDNLFVVGRWKSGLDGIFPQEIVEEMIEYWAPRGHVIWENVLVSANIGRWAVLSKKLEPITHNVWAFLDTPLQVCIDRVFERRAGSAIDGFNHRQENSEVKLDVIAGHWRRCRRAAARAVIEGIDVRWIDHTQAYEQVYALLVEDGGWRPSEITDITDLMTACPDRWQPTEEELQLVLKTARLPWEPEDTMTKVDFVSPPKQRGPNNFEFGTKIQRWGGELEAQIDVLGTTVRRWPVNREGGWVAEERGADSSDVAIQSTIPVVEKLMI